MSYGGSCLLAENAVEFFTALRAFLETRGIELEPTAATTPDVVFACGLLTRERIAAGEPVVVVAAPVFPGETTAVYRSVVVSRTDGPADLASAQEGTLAVNEYGSWSGWHGYVDDLAGHGLPVPHRRVVTGGHRASVGAVRHGDAAVAAIDSSLWRWLPGDERDGLRVIHETVDWPAPPLSVRAGTDDAVVDSLVSAPATRPATRADYDFMLAARTPLS
ncbi:MAG: PhnD/SsuA/transferrin family substrate-binding protein [Acidimicrobiales bacterium]|nr:PhnD/SsuA/transferrin family substrate-binding protein [Acidimicrobiales bacterium]